LFSVWQSQKRKTHFFFCAFSFCVMTRGRFRNAAGVAAVAVLATCALLAARSARPVALFEPFDAQPRDPLMTPLFMGYDAEQNAARELARITGPLQGAFSPASQAQLYQRLHGLTSAGPGGGRFVEAPGGKLYEVEALPFSRRQGLADGYIPVGDDAYDDAVTRRALDGYRQDQQALQESSLRRNALGALGEGRQPLGADYGTGDVDDDEITRKALESYRQELAAPVPEEVEQPVALNAHALPEDVQSDYRARKTARKQTSLDKVQRLYEKLQNPRDRAAATVLLHEDASANALQSAIARELPLQNLEGQMKKELRLTGLKMRDAQQVKQLGEQELVRYHKAVKEGEALDKSNVHYLKASHNYAVEARKEVLDAQRRDVAAAKVLEGAPAVLRAAHTAQVKARVTDNAAGLRRAGDVIDKELSQVEAARAGETAAAKERADAKENAFVSRVINRVRRERFGGVHPSVKALAEEGAKAHKDISEADQELASNLANHVRAGKWLKRAEFQDEVHKVTTAVSHEDGDAVRALRAAEKAGRSIDAAAQRLRRYSTEAAYEERAAKQRELAAAALHA